MKRNVVINDELRCKFPMNLQFFAEGGDEGGAGDKGSEGDEGGDGGAGDKGGAGSEGDKDDVLSMTQAELTAKMTAEKKQGRLAVLKELGIDTDDVKTNKEAMEKFREWQKSQKTELELAQEEAKKVKKAEKRAIEAERKLEAIQLGVSVESVEDLMVLANAKVTDEKDFKTVVEEMKKEDKYASFFASAGGKGFAGTGNTVKGKNNGNNEVKGLGERLAANRGATASNSSYFKRG